MEWLSTVLLLTISTTAPATDVLDGLRHDHPELFKVPVVSGYPNDLPASLTFPRQGRCVDLEGADLGGGVFLPTELERVVQWRLLYLETYAPRAQAVVDALVPRVVTAVSDKVAAEVAEENYELGTVITWALVGLVVGAAAATPVILSTR